MEDIVRKDERHDPADTLQGVIGLIRTRLPRERRAEAERLVTQYYAQVDPEDLAERSPEDLYGAALSHLAFARKREPGKSRIRAINPGVDEHGWQSAHTVVEIVNDDMPFLVDSITMAVNRRGLTLHLLVHPVLRVTRSTGGELITLHEPGSSEGTPESFMHVEVDRVADAADLETLCAELADALADVQVACADWRKMKAKLEEALAEIERRPPPIAPADVAEAVAFLNWLGENHYTFIGYRCHDLVAVEGGEALRPVPESGLGVLRDARDTAQSASFAALPPAVRALAREPRLLIITKSNSRSSVHRPGYLDYVGVQRFDASGAVCGEHRFLGLFTSTAYMAAPGEIPLLRRKVAEVIKRAGLAPASHAGKALHNVLATYPRDELFQISTDELLQTATRILQLGERQRFRLFMRRDLYQRFVSCLIYVPRENFGTEVRLRWQQILTEALRGISTDYNVFVSESVLTRVLITVRTQPGGIPEYDEDALEARLAAAARRWEDDLNAALIDAVGESRGNQLYRIYGAAFPAGYREDHAARSAVPDIEMMARLSPAHPIGMSLYQPLEAAPGIVRFKLFHVGSAVPLSDALPMIEHMGLRVLDEQPHKIEPAGSEPVWRDDFGLQPVGGVEVDIDAVQEIFEDAFGRLFRGEIENDDLNRLVLAARLDAGEVVVLRTYTKYLRQIGFALPQRFVEVTLAKHAPVAGMLVRLFDLRMHPAKHDDEAAARQAAAIEQALDQVENLNEDRVLRQFLALILATLRTNRWRVDAAGQPRSFLSVKFDPAKVPGLPEPKPMFEIFVYSPRFEGVHLRGGKVARGGLRWSDRPEDFRTEILGLVKAQMVKNTVIVPVGSKGGFVLKRAPAPNDRDAFLKEGVACYQDYLRGLLDLTDNLVGTTVVPPPDVRRHDPDDPYLVVAADKGTATFSDYANGIAKEYGYWLADAFASGGSAGYDHKKMGITARGAWESVKRHFREMGVDTQTTDFSVVGIGDMSGDVFGNGMLLSRHIKLVAAFDHRHVFLDPDPDPEASFRERERLFALPRSSWADYDANLISKGGGLFPRTAKSIAVTPEVRRVLGIQAKALPPNELISAILRAPVDLLYNGGIGTYVKAAKESHADAGDRASDGVRVNGAELRCKVVAEGGNLGFTQRGRIEYALSGCGGTGGRINTDAIDNSAGVGTSDQEVNIKILLGLVVAEGELTEKQRNKLLTEMTDDVAAHVLRDNYFQTQSLSIAGRMGVRLIDAQARFIRFLERAGRLNRAIEFLPTDEEIAERKAQKKGLTGPELAVLLAYSKIWLHEALLASSLPDYAWVGTALERYFPAALRSRYAAFMPKHPLRREIISTHVVNSMVNRVGATFVHSLMEATGAQAHEVVRAYLLQREIFDFVTIWREIEALDNHIPDKLQADMLIESGRLSVRATTWFLRSQHNAADMAVTIAHFAPCVQTLREALPQLLDGKAGIPLGERAAGYVAGGVPEALAHRVVACDTLFAALDIVDISTASERAVGTVAGVYFGLATVLDLPWLRNRIGLLAADGHWQTLSKQAMRDDLTALQRTLSGQVLASGGADDAPADLIAAWQSVNAAPLERATRLLGELRAVPAPDQAMLSVALRELRNLAQCA
ncbi:MAG: NAD-glutamate dehydrogenase [Burkholderiales bacterium]|nr:NAD-glutamate dehydrogenase [Burkholderiales bacterium]